MKEIPPLIKSWIFQLETDERLHELVELYDDVFIEIMLFAAYGNAVLEPEIRISKRSRG